MCNLVVVWSFLATLVWIVYGSSKWGVGYVRCEPVRVGIRMLYLILIREYDSKPD